MTYEERVQKAAARLRLPGIPPLDPTKEQPGYVRSPRSATRNGRALKVQPENVFWCDVYDVIFPTPRAPNAT